jgi:hypothetical protein
MTDPIETALERFEMAILSGSQDGWTNERRAEERAARAAR